ncbi:GTP-binding protein [Dyella sp.]|uniref:GTP-binding protein n=1 Tax=Dyella sp. TaxID=1869338 RepID=UPI002ED4DB60
MNDFAFGEFKLVFTGPMGAGKTTAIAAISEVPPVRTEVENTDRQAHAKETTTVGLDLGRITLPDGHVVHLYGTPGQSRFRLMWQIISRGAAGVIVLLDASHPEVVAQARQYIDAFRAWVPAGAIVVGLGRTDLPGAIDSDDLIARLDYEGWRPPVFSVDVRRSGDVLLLVRALACILQFQSESESA